MRSCAGRDVVLGTARVHARVVQDSPTGIEVPVLPSWRAAADVVSR